MSTETEKMNHSNISDLSNYVRFKKNVTVDNRGQIVIPKKIRDFLKLSKDSRLEVVMLSGGALMMRKIVETPIPSGFFLEDNKEALEKVHKSYQNAKKGRVVDESEIDAYFKKRAIK